MLAQIIVDIAHANVDKLFTYEVPEGMPVSVGHHVMVPFGRGNRQTEGFVIALSEQTDGQHSLKKISRIIEPYPVLLEEQLELARWMQNSYHCILVDVLRLMIPSQMRGGHVKEKIVRTVRLAEGLDIETAENSLKQKNGMPRSPKQWEIFSLLKSGVEMTTADITAFVPGSQAAIAAMVKKGILTEAGRVTFRRPAEMAKSASNNTIPTLTEEQANAEQRICEGLQAGSGIYLLHGVTGSGKTEVYMRCIEQCIRENKQAIVLVPEISLTPQTVERFRSRFGDGVAVLHSRLSAGERFDEWRRIRLGKAQVAVGARSAVFAPFDRLGLIVIDEEHEQSYQSETMPRYHAVEVAKKRCALSHGTLVLGSATPSLTSYYRAQKGIYELLTLKKRVNDLPLPKVEIVDMREEFLLGNNGIFSKRLETLLRQCFQNGKQAILFNNRRGYSTFVSCRGCGYVMDCSACDISMTYHKTEDVVKCHYCGRVMRVPEQCPSCGKPYLKYFGIGTQQIEEQLNLLFPSVKVLRMDADSTKTKDAHSRLLEQFVNGEAQVLVGTQMIAKGLDFPNVTVVGVVAADATLHIPDYRSNERTFQLLTQVAGRAGRHDEKGSVVVQTYSPGSPSIRYAKEHDYQGFYAYEMAQRRASLFPPFSLFVRILFGGSDDAVLEHTVSEFRDGLEQTIQETLGTHYEDELLYSKASRSPIRWKQGIYRYQVLIKLLRTNNTAKVMKAIYQYTDQHRNEWFTALEINPQDMF